MAIVFEISERTQRMYVIEIKGKNYEEPKINIENNFIYKK